MSRYFFGDTPNPYSVFNPPDYWTQMVTDPTQVPVQMYPGGGAGYYPYGPYPGFYYGSRTMTIDEAKRHARERQKFMERRAEVSSDPSHKYLTAQGRLDPRTAAALQRAKMAQGKKEDPIKKIQKRMVATVLIGAILSALLK